MGRPGFWQFVCVVALVVLFFHRPLVALLRQMVRGKTSQKKSTAGGMRAGEYRCAKCGAALPTHARFCTSCGRPQDVIDV